MFCSKCGAELPDDALFCSKCGARMKQGDQGKTTGETGTPKDKKTTSGRSGKMMIGVFCLIGMIAAAILAGVFLLTRPKTLTVDLRNYITVSWRGLSSEGTADVSFDRNALVRDLTTEKELDALQSSSVSKLLSDIDIPFQLSKASGLSNGDKITVTSNIPEELLKGEHIALKLGDVSYTIERLIEIQEICFEDYTTVEFSGYEGYGGAMLRIDREAMAEKIAELILLADDSEEAKAYAENQKTELTYSVLESAYLSSYDGLSNGDQVTATVAVSDNMKRIDRYGILFTGFEKEFEVSGLGDFEDFSLLKYVRVEFSGYEGNGRASCEFDRDGLLADVQELGERGGSAAEYVYEALLRALRTSTIELSSNYGLKNGDEIKVTLTIPEGKDIYGSYGLHLLGGEKTVSVENLIDVIEIPIAESIEITLEGYDGAGFQRWSLKEEKLDELVKTAVGEQRSESDLQGICTTIRYYLKWNGDVIVPDTQTDLKNGDILTYKILAVTDESLQRYGVVIPAEEITLEVTGLTKPQEADLTDLLAITISGTVPDVIIEKSVDRESALYACLNTESYDRIPTRIRAVNGDSFTVELEYDALTALRSGYQITNSKKTYTIEGLPTYHYTFTSDETDAVQTFMEQRRQDILQDVLNSQERAWEMLGADVHMVYWNFADVQLLEAKRCYTGDTEGMFSLSAFVFEAMVPVQTSDGSLETRSLYKPVYAENIVEDTDKTLRCDYSYEGGWYAQQVQAEEEIQNELSARTAEWSSCETETIAYEGLDELRDKLYSEIVCQEDILTAAEEPVFWIPEIAERTAEDAAAQIEYYGHRYYLFEGEYSWSEADRICEKAGGHLATITSSIEQNVLRSLLQSGSGSYYWIGLTDQNTPGYWYWSNEEPFAYASWNSGQPNNNSGHQRHAAMERTGNGNWNDLNEEEDKCGFILEIESEVSDGSAVMMDLKELIDLKDVRFWSSCQNSYGDTGYGVIAFDASNNAWAKYRLGGCYGSMTGRLSVYSEAESGASLDILIFGDGKLLMKQTGITRVTKPISFEVDLTGVDRLEIFTRNTGDYSNGFLELENARLYPIADTQYSTSGRDALEDCTGVAGGWERCRTLVSDAMGYLYGGGLVLPIDGEESSLAAWNLDERYQEFSGILTTDGRFDRQSEAQVVISGDGEILYSGVLSFRRPKEEFCVDVTGVRMLTIETKNLSCGSWTTAWLVQESLIKTEQAQSADNAPAVLITSDYEAPALKSYALESVAAMEVFDGHVYYLIDEKMSWTSAESYCRRLGGHLAVITSAEEQMHLNRLLDKSGLNCTCWLGASDEMIEGLWESVTGEDMSQYQNWASGQPDNYVESKQNENYLGVYANGTWNDFIESKEHRPILEFSADETIENRSVSLTDLDAEITGSDHFGLRETAGDIRGQLQVNVHRLEAYSQAYAVYALDGKYEKLTGSFAAVQDSASDRRMDLAVFGDGRLLFEKKNYRAWQSPLKFSADLTGVKTLSIRACPSEGYDGCELLLYDAYLQPADKPEKAESVSLLTGLQTVDFSEAETHNRLSRDSSGRLYEGDVSIRTNGYITYLLGGKYQRLQLLIGAGKATYDSNVFTVRIYADDELLFEKEGITRFEPATPVELEVTGRELLRIEVSEAQDRDGYLYFFDGFLQE